MKQQDNTTIVRNLFETVFSGGNADDLRNYFTENVQLMDSAVPKFKGGIENLIRLEGQYNQAFQNRKVKIDEITSINNLVIVRWTLTAIHKGTLAGYKATGNKVTFSGISFYEFSNSGKIQAVRQLWDRLSLLEQIGQAQPLAVSSI